MKLHQWISKLVVAFPKTTLIVFVGFTLLAASFIPALKKDPTPYLLPITHESRVNLAKMQESYTGSKDSIIVLLEAKETIFNAKTLARVKDITLAFENLHILTDADRAALLTAGKGLPEEIIQKITSLANTEIHAETWMEIEEIKEDILFSDMENHGVNKVLDQWIEKVTPVIEVTSLANTDNILGKGDVLDVSPVFENVPQTQNDLARLQQNVVSNDLFQNFLVSGQDRYTGIVIELGIPEDNTDDRYLVYQKIKDILETRFPGDEKHYIAGMPVVSAALGKVMQQDTKRLFPIVLFIVIACLFLTYRMIKGIFVPLAVVLLSLVVTLGLKSFLGIPLNIITTTLPVFILSIGVADGIHMFSEYRDMRQKGYDKIKAVQKTLHHLTMPVIMTSVTTAFAFYSISLTQIIQLRHFGVFVGIGTLVAMFFSLFFIPA
ncbi:MAG: MMPL family transporter, partial [Desulfobacteraceae bacterium]|nr:MMPL family transporter [Desulfobacteraceae bacterium]